METCLAVNGKTGRIPEETENLEDLLLFVMKNEIPRGEIILEIRVDGKTYSESHANEAREWKLDGIGSVEVFSQERAGFAREFLRESPSYVGEISRGFTSASSLLRDPAEAVRGQEMLLMSLDSLQKFKTHLDHVRYALSLADGVDGFGRFWEGFGPLSERMVAAQRDQDLPILADLLDRELVPLLEAWKGRLSAPPGVRP